MINLDLTHLLIPTSFLELKYKYIWDETLKSINNKYKAWELAFLDVDVNNEVDRIKSYVEKNKDKFESLVVLGIWWSALWTRAILTALKWKYYNNLDKKTPDLYILDNVDPIEINNVLEIINLEKTLFITISKSWSTLETVSQFSFFKDLYTKDWLDYRDNFVVVAWEDSDFKKDCLDDGLEVFNIPKAIWWRFSALTSVWLLPLAFVWIDIKKLLRWVTNIKNDLLKNDFRTNKALLTSLIQYHSYIELWKNITVFFPYVSNLKVFWEWYKQMIGESLGKGWIWVTLSDSVWVTDQHSQLQLYYDWPNDKLVMFLELEDFWIDYPIWNNKDFSFGKLMNLSKYGTQESLSSYNKINYTIKLSQLNEETLWELIIFFETQTAILWELYWFNAFDQPWVEIWKKITRKKIKEKFWEVF